MSDDPHRPATVPVFRSLLAPDALARLVGERYGLADVRCRLIKATIRDVYRVDSLQGPFVLIVYRHGRRSAGEIEAELSLLDFLAERGPAVGVAVAPGLRTLRGERRLTVPAPEGARFAVLFRFAEGSPLDRSPEPAVARQYGQVIARLHGVTDSWLAASLWSAARQPLDAALLVDRSLDQITTFLDHRPADLDGLRRTAAMLRRRLAALPKAPPGYGLVHGDVIPTNVLTASTGALILLDFDFCGPGWRVFDVATYLHAAQEQRSADAASAAFVRGYQDVRPLPDWERSAIPLFVAVRELFRLGNWGPRLLEWGSSALPDDQIARHLARIDEAARQLC